MPHFSFMDTVSRMANKDWGFNYSTPETAESELARSPDKLAAYALLELVSRFNQFVKGMRTNPCDSREKLEIPTNAKPFHEKSVGDFVWSGDLGDGFCRSAVLNRDENGILMIADCDYGETEQSYVPRVQIAYDGHYATLEEAIQVAAESDIEWYSKRLDRARSAIAAIQNKESLEPFMNGIDD